LGIYLSFSILHVCCEAPCEEESSEQEGGEQESAEKESTQEEDTENIIDQEWNCEVSEKIGQEAI
jgi:hypothetical protein